MYSLLTGIRKTKGRNSLTLIVIRKLISTAA